MGNWKWRFRRNLLDSKNVCKKTNSIQCEWAKFSFSYKYPTWIKTSGSERENAYINTIESWKKNVRGNDYEKKKCLYKLYVFLIVSGNRLIMNAVAKESIL